MLMWKGGEDGREDKNRERRAGREGGDKEGRTGRGTNTMVFVGGEGRENANGRGDGEVARHRSILLGHDHALPSYHGSALALRHGTPRDLSARPFDRCAGTIECMDPTDRHGGR